MRTKLENAITLTDDILQSAIEKDEEWKREMIAKGKAKQAVGESFFVFHLRSLQKLLQEIQSEQ